jgi:hypothetical protein
MNKITQEVMDSLNILITFHDNIPHLLHKLPETREDLEILKSYVDYEIKKTLKDIIHIERL